MRKFFTPKHLLLFVMFALAGMKLSAQVNHIVISQVYGGGGNSGAQYQNDFVELFNPTTSTVTVTGWSVQYASAAGNSWAVAPLTGTIAPGKYYLVKLASNAAVGAVLPAAEATNTGINMSGTAGKVALSSNSAALTGTCPSGGTVVDFIGFGSTANCFEGAFAPAPSNTTADIRKNNGCTETDNNSADFATGVPNPRNGASPANICVNPAGVSTGTANSITTSGALSGGNISSDGGAAVTARGVVWGISNTPTIALSTKTNDGTGTGSFSSTVIGLTANTKYFYRAYATNSAGTAYGLELNFTSLPNAPGIGSGSNPVTNGFTANWTAPSGGTETFTYTLEVDDDNGFVSINSTQPGIASGTLSFNVTGLSPSTIYYYRVKAVNVTGSSVYSAVSAGIQTAAPATPVISQGSALAGFGSVCLGITTAANSFSINGTDLDGSNINIAPFPGFSFSETSGGIFSSTLSFAAPTNFSGKQIYVKFTPTIAQSYDGNISLSGGGVANFSMPVAGNGINTPPTAITVGRSVSGTTAILSGSITATGCSAITAYGFEYSTTAGFANGTGIQVSASNLSGGSFSATVSGLSANLTYYFKALATNAGGTSYGAQQNFTTSSIIPVPMASQPLFRYTENFSDITSWGANFTSGAGASRFGAVAVNAAGTIPDGIKITTSTATFSSGTSGGVQKGTGNLQLLATGASDNTSAVAVDFYMDFTGVNAGTLSFDWASVNNSTGNRNASLRVYATVDGTNFMELTAASVLNFTNNVPTTGTVNSIALPGSFNNNPNARLRFYYNNGTGGATGSRPKVSIDNLIVTAFSNTPCTSPAAPTALTFGTITETSIQGSFAASSPAANEYLVIMSTNNSLTSNPLDGQVYNIGDNVGDGDVIAKGSATSFTTTGLTGATGYYFFVFALNSVCTGGPLYSTNISGDATTVAGLPTCAAPADQPASLVIGATTVNSIQASFTAGSGNEYLVLQSADASLTGNPVNGTVYSAGDIIGNAKVIQRNSATSFTATGLTPNTQYYYFIISLNSQACVNGPAYNTSSPLSGSQSTLPLSPCAAPSAQAANLALNASNSVVTGTFNSVAGTSYNYLVIRSTAATLPAAPADNTDYNIGDNLGGGTVIGNSSSTSFNTNNLAGATTYYFFIFSVDKNCTGGTKYLTAAPLTGSITTSNAPAYNYYFGTLHSHSDYSDGEKDHPGFKPADGYNYALGSHGMDFLGISEHNHFSSLDNPGDELYKYHLGVSQADSFTAVHPGFLALYGMEWGVISGGGHVVVYGDGMNDLFGWESNVNGTVGPNYDVYVPKSVYTGETGLFKTVNDYVAKNTFATLAHPNNTDYNNLSNVAYDSTADAAISGTAVESGPATSLNTTYSNPGASMFYLWYYQKLLSKGYHLGPTIDHDNHNTTFGRTTNARTAVISPSLTKTDLLKAIRDMHFYASEDYDTKVDFTINTRIMGSIFEDRNAPSISVNISDATNSTSNAIIRIMFGVPGSGVFPVQVDSVIGNSLSFVDNNLPNHSTGYYYADITNGITRTVTSPVWYTRTCAASSDTSAIVCDSFNWYGTIYTASATAAKTFTTVGGCDSVVTLHLTVNYSPVSAAITTAAPTTACPATGVVFNATADAGANGAIASYQWLKDGMTVPGATANSFTALQSGSYTVKAFNGNNCFVASNAITATVEDNTAPVADAGTLPAVTGECSVTLTAPTATDNCAGIVTGTTSTTLFTQQGIYTVTWTYSDGNGNSSAQTQTVTVHDVTAPVFGLVAGINVSNDAAKCGAAVNINVPAATDNCGVASVTGIRGDGLLLNEDYPVGTTTITWTATDVNGLATSVLQSVTVTDTELPVITAPAAVSTNADAGSCAATNTVLGNAVTTDNCGVGSVSNNAPAFFPVGITTVIWTVTDIHGNTATATQTVTVSDIEMPTITAPGAISTSADAGSCAVANIVLGNAATADNCGVANVSNDAPASFPVGTTTVTWTVTDIHGNTATATQLITVADTEKPTITAPAALSVPNDPGQCGATIAGLGTPVTGDNCGVASVSNNAPASFPVGTTTVTWTVTDIHGNTATATQLITVTDTEKPAITAPAALTVPNDPGQCGATIAGLGIPVTGDNCSVASVSNDHPSTSFPVGVTQVTWTVTDNHGWTNTVVQTVTVTDSEKPVVNTQDITVYLDASGNAAINAAQINNGSTDNCAIASVVLDKTSFNCSNTGSNTVVLAVTDVNGNSNTKTATVTVVDNTKPTAQTKNITVYLNASGSAAVAPSQVDNGSADNCSIASLSLNKTSFTCANLGNNTVMLTVTDASGNTDSKTATVTVADAIAPSITTIANQAFCANATNTYTVPALTATDNCGIASVNYVITGTTARSGSGPNASGTFNAGVSTITWTVKDAGNNTSTSSTIVTISPLPAVAITVSNADAFCNKITLTASSAGAGATYKWVSGSSTVAASQQLSLGQANGDGVYSVSVTLNGCTSAVANYNFQKQTLVSSYTILAFDDIDLGTNNTVASGSIGVTSAWGEAEFGSNSSVSSPGSFVKAKYIDKNGSNINITNPVYSAATGITLPTMLFNTANTNNLPNATVNQNVTTTLNGNYKNLTLKKGSNVVLTGNTFGTIKAEQGAQVKFTAVALSIDKLQVTKGPRNGYSYVRFAPNTNVLVGSSVSIGSQVYVNPDNNKVTFYLGDKKNDDERFTINGGDTRFTANIYLPDGKLKVTGGYRYGDYGNGYGDCDRDDDEDRYYGQGNSYVYMTGLFIAQKVEGNGRNVIWNSFDCNAAPVPVITNNTITQSANSGKVTGETTEEELKITVMPNPSTTYFTLKLESRYQTPVNMRVMDAGGRVVDAKTGIGSNSVIQVGRNYSSGTYYAEMIQGTTRKVIQLVKGKG